MNESEFDNEYPVEYVQKVPADQMCWMHLKPLGVCSCDYIEV